MSESVSNSPRPVKPPSADQVFHFLTHPRRGVTAPEDQVVLASAERLEILHRGLKLVVWCWGDGPAVLLLHGWESHAGHMTSFVPPLLQAGFRVYALDAPGHGQSEGEATDAVDFGRAVLSVVKSLGMPRMVVGHSVGSAAALFAFNHGVDVSASVHLAGPSSMERVLRRGCVSAGLDAEATQQVLNKMAAQIGEPLSIMDLQQLQSGLRHRAYIVHDVEDREIPFHESLALSQAWHESKFEAVTGLGHRRIMRAPEIVKDSVAFLTAAGL